MTEDIRPQLIELLPRLRRFALSLCADRDEANELVQAVCEKALSRQQQYRAGTRLHSWLFRIAHGLWIDDLRARRRRGAPLDPALAEAALACEDLSAERQHTLQRVLLAITQLPEEQRAILVLTSVEGLSYREAARTLDIPLGTAMSRLARARKKLYALTGADDSGNGNATKRSQ